MQSTKTLKRHAALVDKMATAQGIDLEETMLRGRLSMGELDDAVLRCTGCTQPETCEGWLAAGGGAACGLADKSGRVPIRDRRNRMSIFSI